MLLFWYLPDLQVCPFLGTTSYLSSFPNGRKRYRSLLSKKAAKQMRGRENSPGRASAAPTTAPEVSHVAHPGVGERPPWKHPSLVCIRKQEKTTSSLGACFPCFFCWWKACPCCPLVSLGCLTQALGDPSRSGHGAAGTQPRHASASSPPRPVPEAGA